MAERRTNGPLRERPSRAELVDALCRVSKTFSDASFVGTPTGRVNLEEIRDMLEAEGVNREEWS